MLGLRPRLRLLRKGDMSNLIKLLKSSLPYLEAMEEAISEGHYDPTNPSTQHMRGSSRIERLTSIQESIKAYRKEIKNDRANQEADHGV